MKTQNLFPMVALIATLLLNACKGPEGPIGPQGPQGAAGQAGSAGTNGISGVAGATGAIGAQGPMGNANVVYSEWLTPDWKVVFNAEDVLHLGNKITTNPLLTQEAIDKGLVYVYFKGNAITRNQETQELELKERISQDRFTSYFKIPGRTTNLFSDYTSANAAYSETIGVNYLEVYGSVNKRQGAVSIPEFIGKEFSFYNDLLINLHKYRVIVVNGSTKGRFPALDMSNYTEVKKALNIKD